MRKSIKEEILSMKNYIIIVVFFLTLIVTSSKNLFAINGIQILRMTYSPTKNSEVHVNSKVKIGLAYTIDNFKKEDRYFARLYLMYGNNELFWTSAPIWKQRGSINFRVKMHPYVLKRITTKQFYVTCKLGRIITKNNSFKVYHISKSIPYRKGSLIPKKDPSHENFEYKISLSNMNKPNNAAIIPGEKISGKLHYSIPKNDNKQYTISFYEIIDGNKILKNTYMPLNDSTSFPIWYTFPFDPPGSAKNGTLQLQYTLRYYDRGTDKALVSTKPVTFTWKNHEETKGSWKEINRKPGREFNFAYDMTPLIVNGKLHLSYSNYKAGISLLQWNGSRWSNVSLPKICNEKMVSWPEYRSHKGVLYLSFLKFKSKTYHRWYFYKRVNNKWSSVCRPLEVRKFKYGIVGHSFNVNPKGELIRIWSKDYASKFEKFNGRSWRRIARVRGSYGYYNLEYVKNNKLIIGCGEPGGYSGAQVKELHGGKLLDRSRGIKYLKSAYISEYSFFRDKNDLYYAFRGNTPKNGISLFKLHNRTWRSIGKLPVAFTQKGDCGDAFGVCIHNRKPHIAYRESGMDFIPMVMIFNGKKWKPLGRPGFLSP